MTRIVPKFAVVDLFAGPGGLAEGFSAVTSEDGAHPFHIALSVEKDKVAHSTLLLRSFLRQFNDAYPQEYYDFLQSGIPEPDWSVLYPDQWRKATEEAIHLELGSEGASDVWGSRVDAIRRKYGSNTLLIGGPPCQAYSLMGRARNIGIKGYKAEDDPKHFLYEEYISILTKLRPAAFVMENVKGMLSSQINKGSVFDRILADLRSAGGESNYQLIALAAKGEAQVEMLPREVRPADFVVRGEDFGLPQSRHRVIVVGVRRDIYDRLPASFSTHDMLKAWQGVTKLEDVLDGMPKLRSGLSKGDDSASWAAALEKATRAVYKAVAMYEREPRDEFRARVRQCEDLAEQTSLLPRAASKPNGIGISCPDSLKRWLLDCRLKMLPNNSTRGHMSTDLARYLFVSIYGEMTGFSPKASDFPESLAPKHVNWGSGKFADRFRVQLRGQPSTTITCHISKDGHYYIHPDPEQCRSLTVREAARLQTFPDNYLFKGNRTEQYIQVGNAVPPFLAKQIGDAIFCLLSAAHKI